MFHENRGIIFGISAGLIALIAIVTGVSVTMNNTCQSAFWDHIEVYPDAQLVSQQADFFGVQRAEYFTPDSVATVNDWFRTEREAQMRSALDSLNLDSLPTNNWVVEPSTGQDGSTLTLQTTCP